MHIRVKLWTKFQLYFSRVSRDVKNNVWEQSTAPTTCGIPWIYSNFIANLSIAEMESHPMYFLSRSNFIAWVNWLTAFWLVDRSILYKFAMLYMKLLVANFDMETVTLNRYILPHVGIVFLQWRRKSETQELKCENIHPHATLNFLALNEPSKFRSKNPDCPSPLSWAHKPQDIVTLPSWIFACQSICIVCCQCYIKMNFSSLTGHCAKQCELL